MYLAVEKELRKIFHFATAPFYCLTQSKKKKRGAERYERGISCNSAQLQKAEVGRPHGVCTVSRQGIVPAPDAGTAAANNTVMLYAGALVFPPSFNFELSTLNFIQILAYQQVDAGAVAFEAHVLIIAVE